MSALDDLIQNLDREVHLGDGETSPADTEQILVRQEQALSLVFQGVPSSEESDWLERLGIDPNVFGPYANRSNEYSARTVSFAEAMAGLQAAATALIALYRRTNQRRYSDLLDIVTLEAATIVKRKLAKSSAVYRALTAEIGSAAGALRTAHADAKQLADDLRLTASILGAFGSLAQAV